MSTLANPKFTFAASVEALAGEMRRNPDAGGSGWSKIWLGLGKSGVYGSLCLIMVLTLCLSMPRQLSITSPNRSGQAERSAPGDQAVRQVALTAPMPALIYKGHAAIRGYLQSACNVPETIPGLPGVRRTIDLNAPYRSAASVGAKSLSSKWLYSRFFTAGAARGLLSLKKGRVVVLTANGGMRVLRLLDKKTAGESGELKPALFVDQNVGTDASLSLWNDEPLLGESVGPGRTGLPLVQVAEYSFCRRLPGLWSEGVRRMAGFPAETLPPDVSMLKRSSYYRKYVDYYAVKYNMDASLIMAIMHTESNFNPFAVSKSNALGLMQIVPETAGMDVYTYLTGKRGSPTQATLLEAEYNIQYGITYLHLLNSAHFSQVLDTASREMCVIAAYNGGPGAVLRTFDADKDVAFATINSMTPGEVYEALISKMPSPESRRYVETVLGHMKNYN